MSDVHEQTIVISDLLSFLACKIKLVSKDKLLKTLRQFYSEKDINEAHRTLLASLPEKKSTRHGRRVKHPDSLIAMYDCFQLIPDQDLPIFVCKNLNNVPELDVIKEEPPDTTDPEELDEETEAEIETGVEQVLREEQKTMKSQIADIAFVVKQLKEQLDTISHSSLKPTEESPRIKLKRKEITSFRHVKKFILDSNPDSSKGNTKSIKKRGLAYLQSLIDEDEERSDKDQSDKEIDSDFQDELGYSDYEFDYEESRNAENIGCEVILKEEPEVPGSKAVSKTGSKKSDIFLASPSPLSRHETRFKSRTRELGKGFDQKVIYIKNEEDRDAMEDEDEENSIEIASASDYLGQLEDTDPSSRIGTLDSIITISKNSSPESIVIEKIEATNGEGYYYKCQRCEFICNEEKMILKHECNSVTVDVRNRKPRRRDRVSAANMWMCTICDAYVVDVVEFNEHMLEHYKIEPEQGMYECVLCILKTDNHEEYKNHLLEHSWNLPYACDLCDYRSTKELRMKKHAVKHLECKGPNHFECLICGKICGTRNALEKHKQRHKKNYDFKCEICGLTFRHRSALSQHTLIHTKERTYVCHICSYRYDSQHSLDVHVKVHFRDNLFTCHICNQKFKSKNAFRTHVLTTHEGIKPFKCDLCDDAFIFKHTMLIHRKTHGNQLHVCGYCNKQFKSQHYLKIHCAIHEGKNPFKCSSCDFDTSSKAILRKHMLTHNESGTLNLLSCDDCSHVTICPNDMEKHVRANHPHSIEDNKMVIIMEES